MVTDISWWALDGCCYFLVGSGWLLLFPGGQLQITCQLLSLPRCTPTSTAVRTYREHSVNRHRVSSSMLPSLPGAGAGTVQAGGHKYNVQVTFR